MLKYDFIILYEHRNRELENAVLLATMLKKKGYKVAIEYRWSARILFQRTDVIIAPYLYFNETVIDFAIHPFCHVKKIINLPYEQVFLKKDEDLFMNLPKDSAINAIHVSWGKNTTNRLKKVGVKEQNIFEIGSVSIDLNMPKYQNFFLSKEDIARHFGISHKKKWFLFISSFSCVGLTKDEYKKWKKQTISLEYFTEISYNSQPIILDYLEKLVKDYPEMIVIYRPHPHEATCQRLAELKTNNNNFKVISDFSIRQWILVSDYVSTWCSTSIADIFFANKPCAIIRPIPFIEDYDYNMYRKQKIISNYSDLKNFVSNSAEHLFLDSQSIQEYYCNDQEANAFEKLRDLCILVKNNNCYKYNFFKDIHVSPIYLFMLYVYKILLSLAKFVDYSKIAPKKYRSDIYYSHREMKKNKEEIDFYKKRFFGL